jgi:hypothetical protein
MTASETTVTASGQPARAMDPVMADERAGEATVASTWQALAQCPVDDQLLEWPPDVFALTEVVLASSEAYRFVLSPPGDLQWPPARFDDWPEAVKEAGRQWSAWAEDRRGPVPGLVGEEWGVVRGRAGQPLRLLADGRDWRLCEAVLTLHAIADEACAGLDGALDGSDGRGCVYRARGRELLARTGSLARIGPQLMRVLPKVRTPLGGTNLSSFSQYAALLGPGVAVRWDKVPVRRPGSDPRAEHVNSLLLPWPLRVRESDFRPVDGSVQRLAKEPFGLFEFRPAERLDLDLVDRTLAAALDEVDIVEMVVLPESAIDETEIAGLEAVLSRRGVAYLITGVRQGTPPPGRLPGNWMHFGVNPCLGAGEAAGAVGRPWFHFRQNKHHRWSLDQDQITQYHLGGALHPHIRWWEATDVPRRTIQFVRAHEVTMVSLVCEDLAQSDNVAQVIRSVGPTLVVTPLLDGPQLISRWAARYASVFADDPGSAVLTLTSYGLAQRCRPPGHDPSPVVALWKDPSRGAREIPLEPGAHGVLATVCIDAATRRSADGRWPVDNSTDLFDLAVYQVHAAPPASDSPELAIQTTDPPPDTTDLTIITGWAEGLAEALASAPTSERALTLLAEARPGAPWRAPLGIPQPSHQLSDMIDRLGLSIRAATPATTTRPTAFDTVLAATSQEDQPGESELDALVRRVLRSVLEQLRIRNIRDTDKPPGHVPGLDR